MSLFFVVDRSNSKKPNQCQGENYLHRVVSKWGNFSREKRATVTLHGREKRERSEFRPQPSKSSIWASKFSESLVLWIFNQSVKINGEGEDQKSISRLPRESVCMTKRIGVKDGSFSFYVLSQLLLELVPCEAYIPFLEFYFSLSVFFSAFTFDADFSFLSNFF